MTNTESFPPSAEQSAIIDAAQIDKRERAKTEALQPYLDPSHLPKGGLI